MNNRDDLDIITKILHLGLVVFGILALLTGDMADDYKKGQTLGLVIHSWLGIGAAFFVCVRGIYGVLGPVATRFTHWVPYCQERMVLVGEDIRGLMQFKLPDRQPHQGLAALVESLGLVLLFFLAATGVILFGAIEPGKEAQGVVHFIEELHEGGEILLPLFLIVHGGAVLLHAMTGNHLWRKMFFLK